MINLFPNEGAGAKFASWTPTLTGTSTVPVGSYSATSGPDSNPGLTLSVTYSSGTGGVEAVSPKFAVAPEDQLFLSVVLKASSTTPTLTPWSVAFTDSLGNSVLTVAAASAAAASTSAIQYNGTVGVPVGSAYAVVTFGALSWTSTGYTVVMSSPLVGHA
jgi:hypothetical protein